MRFRLWTSRALFVLSGLLLLLGSVASAGPKEDVAAATMKWAQTLGQNDPDKVVLLYATDGVLWGTLSPTLRADRAALRDYFVTAFKVLPGLKVTFGEQLIRVYGGTAVNTGYYTFAYVKDGETKTLPARYSFTFVRDGENWMIVDHHSSAMPPLLDRSGLDPEGAGARRPERMADYRKSAAAISPSIGTLPSAPAPR